MLVKRIAIYGTLGLVVPVLIMLLIDLVLGQKIVAYLEHPHVRAEKTYRIRHPIFHHGFLPGYSGKGYWGREVFPVCINRSGFRDDCSGKHDQTKDFDFAFIGDSFTEGIGLPYDETFVGQISAAVPHIPIANLGAWSYSPSIYFAKLRYYLERGYTFKHVFVYIDISDVQDEATSYEYDGKSGKVAPRGRSAKSEEARQLLRESFPLFYFAGEQISKRLGSRSAAALDEVGNGADIERSAWTYRLDSGGYGELGAERALEKAVRVMDDLHRYLAQKGVSLSVGVYPWPAQIMFDQRDSLQVRVWREFCASRCKWFVDSFPSFFDEAARIGKQQVIAKYFIAGDVHHNEEGSRLIATEFLRTVRPLGVPNTTHVLPKLRNGSKAE